MTVNATAPEFTLIFLVVYGSGLVLAAYFAQQFLSQNAYDQVLSQARFLMETATATRTDTNEQIKPIIQQAGISSMTFLPQTIPSYSAVTTIGFLRKKYPDYNYREASMNPTNPRDRALDWEADIILAFRNYADRSESTNVPRHR